MSQTARTKFATTQDWFNFLNQHPQTSSADAFNLRKACYDDIEKLRGRKLLVYAARFQDAIPANTPNSIDLSDLDGFTDLVNSLKGAKEVDVLIHSPGGYPDATERIVNILRTQFDDVSFLIPHSAYSAATMLALSGNKIIMHSSATLGPIDPQFNGTPARSIKRGFENVRQLLKTEGPEALPAYIPLIEKYTLELLELCQDAEDLSKLLVTEWLQKYMFKGEDKSQIIEDAVTFFSKYDDHKTHSRPLFYGKLKDLNLNIELANEELSSLLWESYILLNGFFTTSMFYKLFESAHGISWGRQFPMNSNQP